MKRRLLLPPGDVEPALAIRQLPLPFRLILVAVRWYLPLREVLIRKVEELRELARGLHPAVLIDEARSPPSSR